MLRFAIALAAVLAGAATAAAEPVRVAVVGAQDGYWLAQLRLSAFSEVALAAEPDVIIVADAAPAADELAEIARQVAGGAGLVLLLGPRMSPETLEVLAGARGERRLPQAAIVGPATAVGAIATEFPWRAAPQVGARTIPQGIEAETLVATREGDPILLRRAVGAGRVLIATPWFAAASPAEPADANYQFLTWSYFPYLLHFLVAEAAAREPVSFAAWPAAPLPNRREQTVLFAAFGAFFAVTATLFAVVRRYSRRHPEILDRFVATTFVRHEVAEAPTGWDEIGFHRPLGGFLMLFVIALFFGVPMLVGYSVLFRNVVFPFPHALGSWQWVKQFFMFLFTLLDFGTSIALVKYFAELRIHDPRRGLMYIQFFVWWQALSGVAQLALVAGAAVFALPDTDYAAFCYLVLGHALIQLPGFLLLFHHVFSAFQRYDLAQFLTLLLPVLPLPLALGTVRLWRSWGLDHARFGEALGSVFGMAAADYLGVLSLFGVGLLIFRRVYGSSQVLFLAHFGWDVARSALSFGFRAALSGVAVGLSAMAQTLILAETVDNYAELQGIWGFAWETIILYLMVAGLLFDSTRAAVSEAFNNGKARLTDYYLTASLRWGFLLAFLLWGLLSVHWPWLITGVYGEQWARAADYVWLFQIMGLMHILAVLPTPFLQACGRPGLDALTVWFEHAALVVLLYVLTPQYQLWGMLYARVGALLLGRIVPAWWLIRRHVARPPLYPWQCFLAPLGTGVAVMACYRLAGHFFWDGGLTSTISLVVAGVAIGPPLAFFFSGLLGGWDDASLAEAKKAVALTHFAKPLSGLLERAARAGCRLSPLHNRFRIDLADAAEAESRELMQERRAAAERLAAGVA